MNASERNPAYPLRVLILEDNPSDAELMVIALRRAGFAPTWDRVETEPDFRAKLSPELDVILADYSLPQFNGLSALRLLKERGLDIPFIIVTGALGDEKAAECVKEGAADYLIKDRLARLGPAVQRALQEAEERAKLKQTEEALRRSHAELEIRVLQRTAELSQSNVLLRQENDERKRVEAALRESEVRYRTLAETAPDFIYVIGPDARVQYVNQLGAIELGSTAEELVGKTITEIFPPAIAERQWHNVQQVFESGSSRYAQNQTAFPSRVLWLNTWLVPMKDEAGKVQAVFGISRDVTELQRIERALRQRETELRMTVEQMPAVLWTTDTELRFTSSYGGGLAALGLEPGQVVGSTLFEYFTTEDPEFPPIAAHRRACQGQSVDYDLVWRENTYHTRVEPLRDIDGVIIGTLGVASDITARKRAETELRTSRENYRNLFENAPIGIYRTTPEGRTLMANPALLRMLRYSSFYELSLRDLETEGFEPTYKRRAFKEEIERTGEIRGKEAAWTRRDGSVLFVRENARAVRDAEGKTLYYEGTVEDITDRRTAEERLFHLNAVLRAVRSINQLIVREKDRGRLLTGVCQNLVETRGYLNAWILLLDSAGKFITKAEAGLGPESGPLFEKLRQGVFPVCVQEALVQPSVFVGDQGSADFSHSALRIPHSALGRTMSVRLEHGGEVYGVLVVAIPPGLPAGSDEQALFKEVSADIGYALHTIGIEDEHQRAEEALRKSEAEYRFLFEAAPAGIWIADFEGRLVTANHRVVEMLGYELEELKSRGIEMVYAQEGARDRLLEALGQAGKLTNYEVELRRKDGVTLTALMNVQEIQLAGRPAVFTAVRDITDRKQAELALRDSEERFRRMADSIQDGLTISEQGKAIYVNDRACEIFGYPRAELLRASFFDLVAPEDHEQLRQFAERTRQTGSAHAEIEFWIRRKDGAHRRILGRHASVTRADGSVSHYMISTDITERKLSETALRESEERYRSVVEVSPDPIVIHRQGEVVFANSAAARFVGAAAPGELIGRPILSFVHPDSLELVKERLRLMLQEGKTVPLTEEKFFGLDRSIRDVEVAATPIVYEQQPAIMVVFRDITIRKQAEAALKESERRFRTLFEESPVAIGFARRGLNLYLNPAHLRLFGYSDPAEITGKSLLNLIAPEARAKLEELIRKRESGEGAPAAYETIGLRKDGQRFPLHVAATMIQLPDGPATVGFLTDLTERKQYEARLAQLNCLYSVLSQINEAIVRIRDPQTLCQEVCRIAVEQGRFRFAWIGLIDDDTRLVKPIAHAGHNEGYLDVIRPAIDDVPGGLGPTSIALREGHYVVVNNIETAPQHLHWREEALRREYRSLAAFPLRVSEQIIGNLTLYAHEPDAFDADQVHLLEALAADLAFALELAELEQRRKAADDELRENEQRFRKVFEEGPLGVAILDPDQHFTKVNPALCQMLGYSSDELLRRKFTDVCHPDYRATLGHQLSRLFRAKSQEPSVDTMPHRVHTTDESFRVETRFRRKDKTDLWVTVGASAVCDADGKVIYAVIMIEDITQRRQAEAILRERS